MGVFFFFFFFLEFDIITLVHICSRVMLWVSVKHLETVCVVIDAIQIKLIDLESLYG